MASYCSSRSSTSSGLEDAQPILKLGFFSFLSLSFPSPHELEAAAAGTSFDGRDTEWLSREVPRSCEVNFAVFPQQREPSPGGWFLLFPCRNHAFRQLIIKLPETRRSGLPKYYGRNRDLLMSTSDGNDS